MTPVNEEDPAALTGDCPLRGGERPTPDERQPSPIRKFLGGMSISAAPTLVLVLIGLIPMLWFFLLLALPYWFLSLLAAVWIMRKEGFVVGLGVLAGCVIGAVAFCAAFYYQLRAIFGD